MGGRLDAVNIIDADLAILTSIGLDHKEWLGNTRLEIGREKLGIARKGKPLLIGEHDLPKGLNRYISCLLYTSPSPRDGLLSRMPSSA